MCQSIEISQLISRIFWRSRRRFYCHSYCIKTRI